MPKKNVPLKEGFNTVVIWPATSIDDGNVGDFEDWVRTDLNARCQFLEVVTTMSGAGGQGGRKDLFFAIHDEDVMKFAVPRLKYGMRWLTDAMRKDWRIYPNRIVDYPRPMGVPEEQS